MQSYTQISWIISPKYHLFINSELNNLEIPNNVPNGFDEDTEEQKDKYFETEYNLNKQLFIDKKDTIKTYDVILIDANNWGSESVRISLFNSLGVNVYNVLKTDRSPEEIQVSELKNGMYIVTIESSHGRYIYRMVVSE